MVKFPVIPRATGGFSEMWGQLPGPGAKIKTEQGCYTLESLNLGQCSVNIRFPSGRLVAVKIDEFPDFKDTVLRGEEWGISRETAEKKKAALERMKLLSQRRQLSKSRNAPKSERLPPVKKDNAVNPKPNIQQTPKAKAKSAHRRRKKPNTVKE